MVTAETALQRDFLTCYFIAWLVNLIALDFMIDELGIGHEVSQGVLIVTIAILLFLAQKFWVFSSTEKKHR